MNKKYFIFMRLIFMFFLIYNTIALTAPSIIYPTVAGIRINNGTEINWTFSTDLDTVKYNLFYSNDSGINWFSIIYNWGYINHLNDSSILTNISFSGNQNQTLYLEVPKIANISSARLNLTGYQNITTPYTLVYNSFVNESGGDGDADTSYQAIGFGRVLSNYPGINMYFIINNTPDLDADMLGILLGPSGSSPQNKNITYNLNIAETSAFLSGNPADDNTTAYTRIKSNILCSEEWGTLNNVFVNISFDNSYTLDSTKMYILWFEYVSGSTDGAQYSIEFDTNAGITNNYTGVRNGLVNDSYTRLANIRFYNGTNIDISNAWLEVGNDDGVREWNYTGVFTSTNRTNDFNSSLQYYIDNNCTSELWENCTVPITLHSNTTGKLEISAINIQLTGYWWNTSSFPELITYKINITAINSTTNGSSDISNNDFTITHNNPATISNTPSENYSNSTSDPLNVVFNCSATDDYLLSNISLYITNNQNISFSLNQTTNITGTLNTTNWTLSLSNGNYTWNCLSYDGVGNFDWSINRSIKINYTAPPSTPITSGGGSGGSYFECTKNSDCKNGYYCYNHKCVKLFDVQIIKIDSPLKKEQFFNLIYSVKSIGKINNDVLIEFWLEKNNKKITSGYDTIYFGESEEKINEVNLFLPGNIEIGVYDCYVRANYGDYNASAKRTIQVESFMEKEIEEEIVKTEIPSEKPTFWHELWNKIKSIFKIFWENIINNKTYLVLFGVLIIILVLFVLLIKLLLEKIMSKNEKSKNRIKNLIKKKVYTEEGNYVGYIEEVIFLRNHIDSLRIKLNKKIKARKRIKKRGVIVKYKDIKNVNEIVIADKGIEDFLDDMNK